MSSILLLASASPRRRQLLEQIGLRVQVHPADIDETPLAQESPADYTIRLAREKALDVSSVARREGMRWVLAADTVVAIDGELLGKPEDEAQARGMLERLSGRGHEVVTGFCLLDSERGREEARATKTLVRFKRLSSVEITRYLQTGESMDKAGAYGIQGLAAYMVEAIEGSYTNVVGLPLAQVVALMEELGAEELWRLR